MRSTRSAARVLTLAGLLAGTALLLPAGLRAQALLRPGTEARGELKSGDLRLDDNTYADLWRFSGTSGQRVRIIMRSDAFDAYLSMGWIDDSGEFHLVESDDDGAGGTNPQVTAVLPRSGEFVARANTLSEGETGAYTLLLETDVTGDAPVAAGGGGADRPRVVGAITVGTPVSGELKQGDEVLDDDSFADSYSLRGRSGQTLAITLTSADFDAYLAVGRLVDGAYVSLESDDDGAGGTNSKVDVTLPAEGDYIVRANTLFKNKTGSYTLLVTAGGDALPVEAPVSTGGNPLVSSVPGAHMPVVLGQELRGTLGAGDEKISDGSYADIWVYQGRAGETLTMIQRSTTIDAYLTFGPVTDGRWSWEKSDNDGAGGDDAKLVVTLARDGEYWVRPNALFSGEGAYTLMVTSDRAGPAAAPAAAQPAPPSQPVPAAGPLQSGLNLSKAIKGQPAGAARREVKELKKGEETRGRLTEDDEDSGDGTYVDTWYFEGRKGQVAIITMKSEDFRPYVLLGRAPAGDATFSSIESEGAPVGEPAKITLELPANGRYWIRANTFDKLTGRYTLKLRIR
ncbi:MAG: PPC domain-containing protein [Gemmatimonadetes bacterium]|nr:PPC domain-containing protein [Gemmatimonadota bacterium]